MVFLPTVVLFEIHRSGIDFSDIPLRPPSPIKQPMNIDERQRLWFFSRGERIAVIVLLIAIAATLLARRYIQKSPDIEICDTTWLEEEIPVFEEQLSRPQKTREKSKTYTPRQQKLQPIEQERTTE